MTFSKKTNSRFILSKMTLSIKTFFIINIITMILRRMAFIELTFIITENKLLFCVSRLKLLCRLNVILLNVAAVKIYQLFPKHLGHLWNFIFVQTYSNETNFLSQNRFLIWFQSRRRESLAWNK